MLLDINPFIRELLQAYSEEEDKYIDAREKIVLDSHEIAFIMAVAILDKYELKEKTK